MRKILAITLKDVYGTFTTGSLLLLMLVTPLALATIIALAFSDVSGGGSAIQDIPVALVNQDEGTNGAIFTQLLVPDAAPETDDDAAGFANQCDDESSVATDSSATDDTEQEQGSLLDLTETTVMDDPIEARAAVDSGEYAAALIIPPDFSQRISFSPSNMELNPVPVEVYGDSNRSISAGVIRSVAESITNQILAGNITVAATYQTLFNEGMAAQAAQIDPCAFTPAFGSNSALVQVDQLPLSEDSGEPPGLIALFGAAQAAFFALFTASGAAASILEERDNWTLQRLIVSPTSRTSILTGKLMAVFATVLLQLILLFIAFTLVASLLEGELILIWGTNWLAIIAMVIVTALSAAGVGLITGAVAKTSEQAQTIGGVIAILMGLLGGAFFQVSQVPDVINTIMHLSIVRWGSDGFTKLAEGQANVMPELVALLLIGGALFLISFVVFSRRQDI